MNELTFVAKLGVSTGVRAERLRAEKKSVLILSGDIEEREVDPATGAVIRCDMRLNGAAHQKLVSGEFKRPEHPQGRDPRNEHLLLDARRKALARGLPYYFTSNMARVVLYGVATRPGEADAEIKEFLLADIKKSRQAERLWQQIEAEWCDFLDFLEGRLRVLPTRRPTATSADVLRVKVAIDEVVQEAFDRARERLQHDARLLSRTRQEAQDKFGFPIALNPRPSSLPRFSEEVLQLLRLSAFVVSQKIVLYRVLSEAGPRRSVPFTLDPLELPKAATDPDAVRQAVDGAVSHAKKRSGDYETAFLPTPCSELLFTPPNPPEASTCRIGDVWSSLVDRVKQASWLSISRNLVGFLYESNIEPRFRHELGQYYTPDDLVDLLVTFSVRSASDRVLDPACGGGGFLRAAYERKRELGSTHEQSLAETWGCEITTFAAQLSSITLASADTKAAAAYPRIVLKDFFALRPGKAINLGIPGENGSTRVPGAFDCVIGNPPYISYRRQTNQTLIGNALLDFRDSGMPLPVFSRKSDAYVWFLVHSTRFLAQGGRLAFVVSSAILSANYAIPLTRFLGWYYRIVAVVDSLVERWFPDADTNAVLTRIAHRPARTKPLLCASK